MNASPEHKPDDSQNSPQDQGGEPRATAEPPYAISPPSSAFLPEPPSAPPGEPWPTASQSAPEPLSFLRFASEPPAPERIPHIGHFFFLILVIIPMGLLATGLVVALALHKRLYGISTTQRAVGDIHYLLGSEGFLYIVAFGISFFVFPLFWHKGLLAGLQWNGTTALRVRKRLFSAAVVCCFIAVINGLLMPGPTNTPIEKVFRVPGAPWLLFAFGVTFAPFFEEIFFRGFLLPALCTAYDWIVETTTRKPAPPLGPHDHPQWSLTAMIVGSILTSIPFAWMHAQQTGYALGPFLLLVGVSLVLCAVRLYTRSLAASVMVHACYNFFLFSLMMIASGGFRHLDKM